MHKSTHINRLKIIFTELLTVIILVYIYINLPAPWVYYQEIKLGNEFAANIVKYKSTYHHLPDEEDWTTLQKLNPADNYKAWWPEYKKAGDTYFTLTFVEGFDPPYLTYDSRTKTWKKE